MADSELMSRLIRMVPQWYEASCGPHHYWIAAGGEPRDFYSHRPLTPRLKDLLEYMNANLPEWDEGLPEFATRSSYAQIQQSIAIYWLRQYDADVDWEKLLNYFEELEYRTYENSAIAVTLVVCKERGRGDITDPIVQKILDPLAASPHTYIRCSQRLKFIDLCEIGWSDVTETEAYGFHPEFLRPLVSILRPGEIGVHLNRHKDVIIVDEDGLLAARRKGEWFLYDVATFKNCMGDALGDYRVGCNIFEIVFDLSYKRCGALLVYDPKNKLAKKIINSDALLGLRTIDNKAREMIGPAVKHIPMGDRQRKNRKKRVFLELASLDGATIFNNRRVIAFGAMIRLHAEAGSHTGARSTAAHSAYFWGAQPIKISADGEISVLFKSEGPDGQSCLAEMEFM
jgi:hypothetical protein